MAMDADELLKLAEGIARDKSQSATARVRAMELIGRSLRPKAAAEDEDDEAEKDPLSEMDDELAERRSKRRGA
jgi:hypothetical protein